MWVVKFPLFSRNCVCLMLCFHLLLKHRDIFKDHGSNKLQVHFYFVSFSLYSLRAQQPFESNNVGTHFLPFTQINRITETRCPDLQRSITILTWKRLKSEPARKDARLYSTVSSKAHISTRIITQFVSHIKNNFRNKSLFSLKHWNMFDIKI